MPCQHNGYVCRLGSQWISGPGILRLCNSPDPWDTILSSGLVRGVIALQERAI